MVEERSKRALPPRHSFLTDAVCSVLESQSKVQLPQVDSRTVLKLDQDTTYCTIHDEPAPPPLPSSDIQPVVRILPQRRPIKTKSNPAFSDDYYSTRHRKHEMEEKKQKNREKERLEHELYQQQQLVERLKTLDKSTLASIVSSIRNTGVNNNQLSSSSSCTTMSTSDLERLHQTILRDAREQMYRYEQLGLGRKRGQGFVTQHHHHHHHHQQRVSLETTAVAAAATTTTVKENIPATTSTTMSKSASALLQPHSPPPSPPSSVSPPFKKQPLSPPPPPSTTTATTATTTKSMASMVLAHFKAHRQPCTGGKRRSLRTAVAFGEKIPAMDEMEFYLPDDLFGDLKYQRTTTRTSSRRRRLT